MKSIIVYLSTLIVTIKATTLQETCADTPFWKLNICEIDCQKCGAKANCQECPSGFNLNKSKCVENDTIYRRTYFTDAQQTSKSINQYNFKRSNQYFKINDIVTICQPGLYKFDMMGMFNQQERITFNLNFDQGPVTALIFKFNFLTIFQNTQVELVMNGNLIYERFISGSNLKNSYEKYNEDQNSSYLSLPSLTEGSSSVLIRKFNTGPIQFDYDLAKNNALLQIQVSLTNDPKNTSDFWAFSDFSVVAQKCSDCLPQRLKNLSTNVGIAIGVNAGALIILILILFVCVKLGEKKRLRTLQEDQSGQDLPKQEEKLQEKDEEKDGNNNLRETDTKVKLIAELAKKSKKS